MKTKHEIALLQITLCLDQISFDPEDPARWAREQAALLELREDLESEASLGSAAILNTRTKGTRS